MKLKIEIPISPAVKPTIGQFVFSIVGEAVVVVAIEAFAPTPKVRQSRQQSDRAEQLIPSV